MFGDHGADADDHRRDEIDLAVQKRCRGEEVIEKTATAITTPTALPAKRKTSKVAAVKRLERRAVRLAKWMT